MKKKPFKFWNLDTLIERANYVETVLFYHKEKMSLSDIAEKLGVKCRQEIWNIIQANK